MGRIFGVLGIFCLLLIGVTSKFPHLYKELENAVSSDEFLLNHDTQEAFLGKSLDRINELRSPLYLTPLLVDSQIQDTLDQFVNSKKEPGAIPLQDIFDHLQAQFPGAQFLSANVSHSFSEVGLVDSVAMWQDVTSDDYESLSLTLFKNGHRFGCISVLSKRLPKFEVSTANKTGGRFFNRCPHCGNTHAVELDRRSRTLILACPDCQQSYDVLAADTQGMFYRANDFLLGFELPKVVGSAVVDHSRPSEELLLHIWRTVVDHCEYEDDSTRASQREAWKTPDQTWLERSGDCEDTSILLADSLISAGFKARVAIGWNETIGQHAWCVAKVGDTQYVLESTIQDGDKVSLLTSADAAGEYRPEQLFDRNHLYFRRNGMIKAVVDYWGGDNWLAVDFPVNTNISEVVISGNVAN